MFLSPPRTGGRQAWVVLASAMVIAGLNAGIRQGFGVMIEPLAEQHGWSRGAISLAYSLSFISSIPITLAVGWLGERMGVRRILLASALSVGLGLTLTGTVTELWQLYLYYGVILSALGAAVSHVLMPVVITRWFNRKLGLAMGLLWASLGVGVVVLVPLLDWAIGSLGWATAFYAFGVAVGLVLLAASFQVHGYPQDVGLVAYGDADSTPAITSSRQVQNPGNAGISHLRRTPVFWVLVMIHFLGCAGHSPLIAHMVPMAIFRGIPGTQAAVMLSITAAVSIASRFTMSLVADAKGSRVTLGLAMVLQSSPMIILFWARSLWGFYLFAFLFGIGYGGEMVGFPIFNRQFYGVNAPLSTIYSYQMAGAGLGMALGGWLGGTLFDMSGSYAWTITAAAAAGFANLGLLLALPRHRRTSEPLLPVSSR